MAAPHPALCILSLFGLALGSAFMTGARVLLLGTFDLEDKLSNTAMSNDDKTMFQAVTTTGAFMIGVNIFNTGCVWLIFSLGYPAVVGLTASFLMIGINILFEALSGLHLVGAPWFKRPPKSSIFVVVPAVILIGLDLFMSAKEYTEYFNTTEGFMTPGLKKTFVILLIVLPSVLIHTFAYMQRQKGWGAEQLASDWEEGKKASADKSLDMRKEPLLKD
eukprot:gnl/TRDRNA2_/TRDRNA2_57378_c0_seq1.p1 gnl/TRDRNA2_/TRDRNA2_57378_c0~~gnl/TRDRNA2_/TRDRNA2_57378_c0_seq1.p1  ORF type:complete len:219 (+),score=28.43 gnl/TRDRNA2_/TRDRNA2_57378_c0_seq1:78-734(+)